MKKVFCLPLTSLLKKKSAAVKAGRITSVTLTLLLLLAAVVPVLAHPGVVLADDTFTRLTNPSTPPPDAGHGIAFSSDSTYLAVASQVSPFVTIYKRSGDTFAKLADPAPPPSYGNDVAFSHDSNYMAVAHWDSPYVTIYKRSSDNFTKLDEPADPADLPPFVGLGVAFSHDSTYLAVAHANAPYVTIYKRSSDNFTKLDEQPANPPNSNCNGVAFSHDSTYMAVACNSSPYIFIYKRSSDNFTRLPKPTNVPTGYGTRVAFSPNSTYMAVAHATSPYVTIYKRSSDNFTKLDEPADPADLPAGTGRGVAFSPNSTYMAVAHVGSPNVTIYKIGDDDTFTKLNNPTTLPAGDGNDVAFSHDSNYMAVGHYTSPYISIYKRTSAQLIGSDTAGNGSTGANKLILCRFQATETGTANAISVYSRASGNVKVAIYADNSGQPGTLLNANSAATAVTASQWNNIYISPTPITSGNWYWLGAVGNASGAISYNTALGSGTSKGKGVTFSSFVFPKSTGTGFTDYTYDRAFSGWFDVHPPATQLLVGTGTEGDGNTGANKLILCRFQAAETGRANAISVFSIASGNVKVAIYSDKAGQPGTLLNSNNTPTAVTFERWNNICISPTPITSGNWYWLGAVGNATGAISFDKTSGSGTSRGKSVTFSSFKFPKTIGTSGWTNYTYDRAFVGVGTIP